MTHSLLRDPPSSGRSTGVREALLRDFSTGSFVEDAAHGCALSNVVAASRFMLIKKTTANFSTK